MQVMAQKPSHAHITHPPLNTTQPKVPPPSRSADSHYPVTSKHPPSPSPNSHYTATNPGPQTHTTQPQHHPTIIRF